MAFNNYGSRFPQTTPIVLNLIIINALVFLAQTVSEGFTDPNVALDLFALHFYKSAYFKPYQLITYMFMHGNFLHILFNMYSLWMFGTMIERSWGPKRFLIFYLICGIGAGLTQLVWSSIRMGDLDPNMLNPENFVNFNSSATVGASGAIMGLLAAFGYLFPNTEFFIIPLPVPVKAKWLVLGMICLDLFGGFSQTKGDDVAHFAHLGGAAVGFLLVLFWNKTNKKSFY